MANLDLLNQLIEEDNGYLITSKAIECGISKPSIAAYVNKYNLEKVAHGIYITDDVWPDELFILQMRNKAIIYTGETALYAHGFKDREYNNICFSVPTGYNAGHIKVRNKEVHYENKKIYGLGVCEIISSSGNKIRLYNPERCICEMIINRKKYEVQVFQTAIKEYISSKNKNLSRLVEYAEIFDFRDEVMKYVEVLI